MGIVEMDQFTIKFWFWNFGFSCKSHAWISSLFKVSLIKLFVNKISLLWNQNTYMWFNTYVNLYLKTNSICFKNTLCLFYVVKWFSLSSLLLLPLFTFLLFMELTSMQLIIKCKYVFVPRYKFYYVLWQWKK